MKGFSIAAITYLLTASTLGTEAQDRGPFRVTQKPAAEARAKVLKNGLEIRGFRIVAADGTTVSCGDIAKHQIYSNTTGKPLTIAVVLTTARRDCTFEVVRSNPAGSTVETILSGVSDDASVAEVTLMENDALFFRPAKNEATDAKLTIAYSTFVKK